MSTNNAVAVDGGDSTAAVVAKKRSGRPIDPNSKSRQCARLYTQLIAEGKNRQEILKAFETQVGVGHGSAQVYYHEAKNGGKKAAKTAAGNTATVTDTSSTDNG